MLLFVHNETRPFFYQGFQRLGHKEIEKAYQIISIMNRNQIFSQTGDTLPGNGGDRRRISAPRLQGAFSPGPGRACTIRPLSLPGSRGYSSLSQPFAYRLHSITFSPACQEHGRFFWKTWPLWPVFPGFSPEIRLFFHKVFKIVQNESRRRYGGSSFYCFSRS